MNIILLGILMYRLQSGDVISIQQEGLDAIALVCDELMINHNTTSYIILCHGIYTTKIFYLVPDIAYRTLVNI
jgi:hypothetical protein